MLYMQLTAFNHRCPWTHDQYDCTSPVV